MRALARVGAPIPRRQAPRDADTRPRTATTQTRNRQVRHHYTPAIHRARVQIHLGPNQKNYLPAWVNFDANLFTGKCDLWADLRNPLPFADNSVDTMCSHHVIEHLPSLAVHFRDVVQCLKPGAPYRVAGPNGDSAISKFIANNKAWFGNFPDKRESIGGRFENFIFCCQEHLTVLTRSFLEELMTDARFKDLRFCAPITETHYGDVFQACMKTEHETDFATPHTLLVEAVKA